MLIIVKTQVSTIIFNGDADFVVNFHGVELLVRLFIISHRTSSPPNNYHAIHRLTILIFNPIVVSIKPRKKSIQSVANQPDLLKPAGSFLISESSELVMRFVSYFPSRSINPDEVCLGSKIWLGGFRSWRGGPEDVRTSHVRGHSPFYLTGLR
jgi:hypothetical protein